MPYKKYASEFLGTFMLTMAVWVASTYALAIPGPLAAAVTLGLFVYLVGGISGAHLNPAVTIGILSIGKIKGNDALFYIIAQLLGGLVAMVLCSFLSPDAAPMVIREATLTGAFAEVIGTFVLAFAVTSVALNQIPAPAAGLVVGSGLLCGIAIASGFRDPILNPAVALGIGAFGPFEIIAPIVGAVGGAWARFALSDQK